jgi:hypothetical protein
MRSVPGIAVFAALVLANVAWVGMRSADRGAAPARTHALVGGGFTYAPDVSPGDRALIEAAVASARPEARRLIDLVDGSVTLHSGAAGPDAAGTTTDYGDRFDVVLDLAGVRSGLGVRGVNRLVLHELGHVVDGALVPDDLLATMDAQIPAGWVCEEGHVGSCAERQERFAETFAKWATNDIGVDLSIGYKVPPPEVPLDTWGAPLSALGPSS